MIEKIKRLFRWFSVIWNDYDWDYVPIYQVLKFKLQQTAKCHPKDSREVEVINTCCRLIDKLIEEYYLMEYLNYYEDLTIDLDTFNEPKDTKNLLKYLNKYSRTAVNIGIESDLSLWCKKVGINRHNKARELLFKLLNQDIEKWWN